MMDKESTKKKSKNVTSESILDHMVSIVEKLKTQIDSRLENKLRLPISDADSLRNFEQNCLSPLVDLIEDSSKITLTADIPCATKEKINIQATEESISLEAGLIRDIKFASGFQFQQEMVFSCYRKLVKLPAKINPKNVHTTFNQGILTIIAQKQCKKVNIPIE